MPAAPAVRAPAVALSPPEEASPGGDADVRGAVERQALAARDELARTLGLAPPAIKLRFHPTPEAFERATGAPWFVSGAAVNGELHLVPVGALRDRGVLEQTIRRALVHALVDGPLGDRPAWVREGAALFYADRQRASGTELKGRCPTDSELGRPVSIGALSTAYARAKACFARQISAGRSWRDVR